MDWKALGLVFLLLSSLAITIGITTLSIASSERLGFDSRKLADVLPSPPPPPAPDQPIDDESGGG